MEEKFKVVAGHLDFLLNANQRCLLSAGNGELRRTLDGQDSSEEGLEDNRTVVIDAIREYEKEVALCKSLIQALHSENLVPVLNYFKNELKMIKKGREEFLKAFPFNNPHFDVVTMTRGAERHAAQVAQYENFISILST